MQSALILTRDALNWLQRGLGLRESHRGSQSTAASTRIDVAQFPPYSFEEDVTFLAVDTTVSADGTRVKHVEVGVATLDTARLTDQELPHNHDGGHWAEQIEFTTLISHPIATSYACDLEVRPHIGHGLHRKNLALWLRRLCAITVNLRVLDKPDFKDDYNDLLVHLISATPRSQGDQRLAKG
ncbi:hypothetical protein AC579_1221 [Pseudocercospora musae]|uniref:Uncharacterized protein n=1 Tax=Pseudocercospora musae TaxID=113226 RepID=A0A139HAY8_9PEZI|nr:hypothetical protein AC579_1221 [Pseudocercospora musae]